MNFKFDVQSTNKVNPGLIYSVKEELIETKNKKFITDNLLDNFEEELEEDGTEYNQSSFNEDKSVEKPNQFELMNSPYYRMSELSNNELIRRYLNDSIENIIVDDDTYTKFERTQDDILKIIKLINGSSLQEIADTQNKGITLYREEFVENLKSKLKRKSKGSITIDKFGLKIDYELDTDGIVKFTRVISLYNYILSGAGIDETMFDLDRTEYSTIFWDSFSKTYPVIPTNKNMIIDFSLISKNSDGRMSTMDAITEFRNIVDTGWATLIDTRINAGNNHYMQVCEINDNTQVPIMGRYGKVVSQYIPIHKTLTNKQLSEFELKNGFELFSHLETGYNIITMPDGLFGILNEGEFACARKTGISTFDVLVIKNLKKTSRFKNKYKEMKAIDPTYTDIFDDEDGEQIQIKTLAKNKVISTEMQLYNIFISTLQKSSKTLRYKGGNFSLPYEDIKLNKNMMYEPDTLWKDFITTDRLIDESDKAYNRRQYTIGNMFNRFVTQFNIEGMKVTSNAKKYANSLLNNINGINKNFGIIKPIDYEQLSNMTVGEVVDIDMKYSFTKSYCSFMNKKIKEENKNFKEQVIDKMLKGNGGKRIKVSEMISIDKFMHNKLNNIISKLSENNPETILNLKAIKDYRDKINNINKEFGIDLDIDDYMIEYYKQKKIYNEFINQIQVYSNINTLSFRTKLDIQKILEEHNKLTGNNIQIQNFKMQVIDLSNEIIEENKEIINNLEDKQVKSVVRKTNTNLRRLNKILKQNIYRIVNYRDYKTAKQEINLKEICISLKEQFKIILENENIIKTNRYIENINIMQNYIDNVLKECYSIDYYEKYSMNLLSLNNVCVNCA